MILHDCLYVPKVRRNLISIPRLYSNGYSTLFNKTPIFIKWNDDVICYGSLVDNLYLLNPILPCKLTLTNLIIRENYIFLVNQTQLWHLRLGHINLDRICRLVMIGHLSPLDMTALPVYEPCLKGKMTMRPFKAKVYRAKDVLDLVHTDICGLMSVRDVDWKTYFSFCAWLSHLILLIKLSFSSISDWYVFIFLVLSYMLV